MVWSSVLGKACSLPDRVFFYDTTLRDGEQTPGVALLPEEKLEIARQLDLLGVDSIEAGFPATSKGEQEAVNGFQPQSRIKVYCVGDGAV